jgi:hypothetical protein
MQWTPDGNYQIVNPCYQINTLFLAAQNALRSVSIQASRARGVPFSARNFPRLPAPLNAATVVNSLHGFAP